MLRGHFVSFLSPSIISRSFPSINMAPPSSKKTKIPASSPPSSSSSRVPATEEAQSPRSSIDDERSEDEEESTFVSDLVFASVPDSEFTPWVIKQIQRHLATRGSSQQDDSGSLQGSVLSRSTSSTPHGGNEHWRQEGRKQEFTFELKKRRECETGVIMSVRSGLSFVRRRKGNGELGSCSPSSPSFDLPPLSDLEPSQQLERGHVRR